MTPEDLAALHPRLYHLTAPAALPGILRHGLLPTSGLLSLFGVTGAERHAIERRRRPASVRLAHPEHGEAVITDNLPLSEAALEACLDDGLAPADWLALLNGRSRGKGLRAVTHAAFTIGLLDYCRLHALPHPGFVALDSPLLSYRDPEGEEDDLRQTDLKDRFYENLWSIPADRQVLVFENVDPPDTMRDQSQAVFFSRNPQRGRYGFFPLNAN